MSPVAETSELIAFTKTVGAKSLSRAAAELGIPRTTLSRRIAQLEEKLGARLLLRTTRSLMLTDLGNIFYKEAIIALEGKRTARAVLTVMCYSVGSAMRQGSSSLTRLTGQSAMTPSTWRR